MKSNKTDAENKKATAPKGAKAKGADEENNTSAKDAKKIQVTKKSKPLLKGE